MKEFKIKIKTQKQFLVQMNLTSYYSLKLQLLTEYTHSQYTWCFLLPYISTFLYVHTVSFHQACHPLLCLFTQLWSNFFSNSTFYRHEIFCNIHRSLPSLNIHLKDSHCASFYCQLFYSYIISFYKFYVPRKFISFLKTSSISYLSVTKPKKTGYTGT